MGTGTGTAKTRQQMQPAAMLEVDVGSQGEVSAVNPDTHTHTTVAAIQTKTNWYPST